MLKSKVKMLEKLKFKDTGLKNTRNKRQRSSAGEIAVRIDWLKILLKY